MDQQQSNIQQGLELFQSEGLGFQSVIEWVNNNKSLVQTVQTRLRKDGWIRLLSGEQKIKSVDVKVFFERNYRMDVEIHRDQQAIRQNENKPRQTSNEIIMAQVITTLDEVLFFILSKKGAHDKPRPSQASFGPTAIKKTKVELPFSPKQQKNPAPCFVVCFIKTHSSSKPALLQKLRSALQQNALRAFRSQETHLCYETDRQHSPTYYVVPISEMSEFPLFLAELHNRLESKMSQYLQTKIFSVLILENGLSETKLHPTIIFPEANEQVALETNTDFNVKLGFAMDGPEGVRQRYRASQLSASSPSSFGSPRSEFGFLETSDADVLPFLEPPHISNEHGGLLARAASFETFGEQSFFLQRPTHSESSNGFGTSNQEIHPHVPSTRLEAFSALHGNFSSPHTTPNYENPHFSHTTQQNAHNAHTTARSFETSKLGQLWDRMPLVACITAPADAHDRLIDQIVLTFEAFASEDRACPHSMKQFLQLHGCTEPIAAPASAKQLERGLLFALFGSDNQTLKNPKNSASVEPAAEWTRPVNADELGFPKNTAGPTGVPETFGGFFGQLVQTGHETAPKAVNEEADLPAISWSEMAPQWQAFFSHTSELTPAEIVKCYEVFQRESIKPGQIGDMGHSDLQMVGISQFGVRLDLIKAAKAWRGNSNSNTPHSSSSNGPASSGQGEDSSVNEDTELITAEFLHARFIDHPETDSLKNYTSVEGVMKSPLVGLMEAIGPLMGVIPAIEKHAMWALKDVADDHEPLTLDEAAAINLYTREWANGLYRRLNYVLRNRQRQMLKPFFPYLRLLMNAFDKLPKLQDVVYRGVRLDLSQVYPKNSEIIWWGFSSCTTSLEVFRSPHFLGTSGKRTQFIVRVKNGVNIKKFSSLKNEDEVLLPPCTPLVVRGVFSPAPDLYQIEVEELSPTYPLFE